MSPARLAPGPIEHRLLRHTNWPGWRSAAWLGAAGWMVLAALAAPAQTPPGAADDSPAVAVEADAANAAGAAAPAAVDEAARQQLEVALRDYRRGDLKAALSTLRAARGRHHELPPAGVMLARFLLADRQAERARRLLQSAAEAEPDDPEAYLLLGEFAAGESNLVEADSLFQRGLTHSDAMPEQHPRRRPLIASALAGLASVAERRNQWDVAQAQLSRWVELYPEQPQAMFRLARAKFLGDQVDEARRSFDRLREIDPTAQPTPVQIGLLLESVGRHEAAAEEFAAAAAAHPDNPEVRLAVARWALFAGRLTLAQENLLAARAADGDPLRLRLLEGVHWRFLGEPEKAEALFREVHSRSPMNFDAINQLALVLVDRQDESLLGQALEYARLGATLQRDVRTDAGRNALATLARVLHQGGDLAAARRVIDQLLGSGQLPPHAAYYAAEIHSAEGANDVALKLVDAALNSPRRFPEQSAAEGLQQRLRAAD